MAHRDQNAFMLHALTWAETTGDADGVEADNDTGASALEIAEAFILNHAPGNFAEMIIQLEVICDDLDAGHRCDGFDVVAIRAIQRALMDSLVVNDPRLLRFASIRSSSPAGPLGPFRHHELRIAN